jgi:hypothetical protein
MAEKAEKDPTRVQLKDVRLSYPALWKARAFGKKGEGEPAFSASFIIDPETKIGKRNIALIEEAIEEAKEFKWGNSQPKLKADKICFRDGDDDEEEQEGMMVLASRNPKRPLVLDEDRLETTEADGIIYGGCFVDAIVRIWAQDNEYGKRINGSLEAVKFRRDGEAFGARRATADDFDDDDEDEAPRKRRSRGDDDEDEAPKKRRASRDDDDAEDEAPKKRRASRDDDDEDEAPRKRRASRDEDEDEAPRKRRASRDDDEDDRPAPRKRRSRDDDDDLV